MVSRYEGTEIATLTAADGSQVRYLRRRFPPPPATAQPATPPLAVHRVRLGDRLDLISQTYLGDPLAFWMICDANAALDPDALTDDSAEDTLLTITMPER